MFIQHGQFEATFNKERSFRIFNGSMSWRKTNKVYGTDNLVEQLRLCEEQQSNEPFQIFPPMSFQVHSRSVVSSFSKTMIDLNIEYVRESDELATKMNRLAFFSSFCHSSVRERSGRE